VLELFHLTTTDIPGFLAEQDLVFVSGGNTRNLLVLWREWGLDVALKEAINGGLIVGGVSAGANCWFESFSTDSNPGGLSAWQGLGWLNGSFCPHYDEEVDRKPSLTAMMARGEIGAGYAADGGAGILFRNGVVEGVISARQGAKGYRVSWTPESGLCEDPLPVLAHLPS
jgi:peptidase E